MVRHSRAIERNPFWVKPIMDSGAEISLGGYRYQDNLHDNISPEEQEAEIQKSIDILHHATGKTEGPAGQYINMKHGRQATDLVLRLVRREKIWSIHQAVQPRTRSARLASSLLVRLLPGRSAILDKVALNS